MRSNQTRRELLAATAAVMTGASAVHANDKPGINEIAGGGEQWAARWRNWHYWRDHVVPANPAIPGHEAFHNTDGPCVFRIPGESNWFISYLGFNGSGYNTFIAESDDLVHWHDHRLAFGFGPVNEFDHGGRVLGAYLFTDYGASGQRLLKRHKGLFWSLYGCYPKQGGYELRPGYEGVACSEDGIHWKHAREVPILSVFDADCADWEQECIYQPWLLEHGGKYYNFYNAAHGHEQTGLATSDDLISWKRYAGSPIVRNRPGGFDAEFCSDPKVYRDGDHWAMFYFGVGKGGAHIMVAFSQDLINWDALPEPLYRAGGHPGGLDATYAHKTSLIFNPKNKTWYLHYCAVGNRGRGIGLLTSLPIEGSL